MSNNVAIEALLKQRGEIKEAQRKANEQFFNELRDVEFAIETLSGKKMAEIETEYHYDDESPNYIKASKEEI